MRSLFSCHFFHCNVLRRCIHLHSQPSVITSAPSCFFGNNVDTIRQSNSCALHCIGVTSRRLLCYLLFLTLIPATVCSCLRSCLRFVSSSPLISAVVFAQRSNRIRTHTLLSSCETGLVSVTFVSVPPLLFDGIVYRSTCQRSYCSHASFCSSRHRVSSIKSHPVMVAFVLGVYLFAFVVLAVP